MSVEVFFSLFLTYMSQLVILTRIFIFNNKDIFILFLQIHKYKIKEIDYQAILVSIKNKQDTAVTLRKQSKYVTTHFPDPQNVLSAVVGIVEHLFCKNQLLDIPIFQDPISSKCLTLCWCTASLIGLQMIHLPAVCSILHYSVVLVVLSEGHMYSTYALFRL